MKKLFLTFLVTLASIIFLFNLSIGGLLEHTIISPFGTSVQDSQADYNSEVTSSQTETSVGDKFKLLNEYDGENPSEPFCMIGGQYKVRVINDASPGDSLYNKTFKLYYCKTAKDILKRIKIPSSWKDHNLIIYCNDGSNLNHQDTNYDYIINQINTYKACAVINKNITENNTILYGFDVGNNLIDEDSKYYFNSTTRIGPVLNQLDFNSQVGSHNITHNTYISTVYVPYNKIPIENSGKGGGPLSGATHNYVKKSHEETMHFLINTSGFPSTSDFEYVRETGSGKNSASVYTVYHDIDYNVGRYEFYSNKSQDTFFFEYDNYDAFYSLTNSNEVLDKDITTIFDISKIDDLSRVILLKQTLKDNTNEIIQLYGYDKSLSLTGIDTYKEELKPLYIIDLSAFGGDFNTNLCTKTLKKYNPQSTINANTEVRCNGKKIEIVSKKINQVENDDQLAFHLFKNILTSIGN
ncbi:MAG: hypothetical protein ACOC16_01685 [Nanoarchaeota archaeon]